MATGGAVREVWLALWRLRARAITWQRALGAAFSTFFVGTWSRSRAIFESVPRDMHTCDPTRASEFIEGYIALGDQVVERRGRNLFAIPAPSEPYARALHSFEWLRHLRAYRLASVDSESAQRIAAGHARESVLDWIQATSQHPSLAWEPEICARRALSLTNHASFLLDDAEPADYRAIMASIMRDARRAFVHRGQVEDPTQRCYVVLACTSIANALRDHTALKKRTRHALIIALKQAFHSDGGPISRRPGDLTLLLPSMIALSALMQARELAVPTRLTTCIARGQQMLRMLRHPDGTLARFQGTASILQVESDLTASIVFYDTARTPTPLTSEQTGYARLEAHSSVLLMDCGGPPPLLASRQAHAASLAFEWSYGATKLITSAPDIGHTVHADLADQRRTAAQSTVVVGGASSALLWGKAANAMMPQGDAKPEIIQASVEPIRAVQARHSGYRKRFGVHHDRMLTLAEHGRLVEGRDRLLLRSGAIAPGNHVPFAAHFQLQPGALTQPEGNRRLRITYRQQTFFFEADEGEVRVEDPADLQGYRTATRALRIVHVASKTRPAELNWRFIAQYTPPNPAGPSPD